MWGPPFIGLLNKKLYLKPYQTDSKILEFEFYFLNLYVAWNFTLGPFFYYVFVKCYISLTSMFWWSDQIVTQILLLHVIR